MFNRFACFWPKGYQRGSLGKSHQNRDYLKQAMRKSYLPFPVVEQWTGNRKATGSNPEEDNFFALLVLRSRRSGGYYVSFRAGSL